MIRYKCFELHTHTMHSDGRFTPEELCEKSRAAQYDGIALTDHNTMSGFNEISRELMDRTVPVIPGIEWTTFFGHMLVIGAEKYVDWRFALPGNIDEYTTEIKKAKGIVGIAHPFNMGSPMCTGCYWDFRIRNWGNVDYIEVWSEPFPHHNYKNELAFAWWTELLNRGERLAATSGRDWHGLDGDEPLLAAVTYLGIEEGLISANTVKDALRSGRTIVSCGPFINLTLEGKEGNFGVGEEAPGGSYRIRLELDESHRRKHWEGFGIGAESLRLIHNGKEILSLPGAGEAVLELAPGWLRLEAYGNYVNRQDTLVAFTSPVYIV